MPSKAHDRRDPQKGKKGFSKSKGFTAIELMIGVAVVAIIASLALPSYRAIIEKRQVTSAAEQLTAFLGSMKGESVKLNEELALSYSANGQCFGFQQTLDQCDCSAGSNACTISYDYDRDGTVDETLVRSFQLSNLSFPGVVNSVQFSDGDDIMVWEPVRAMLDDDFADDLTILLVSEGDQYALNLQVDRLGRILICNPVGDFSKVPGYQACP
jgi:prepilin-type N-terminal cleavage/methylation domain-containing protein